VIVRSDQTLAWRWRGQLCAQPSLWNPMSRSSSSAWSGGRAPRWRLVSTDRSAWSTGLAGYVIACAAAMAKTCKILHALRSALVYDRAVRPIRSVYPLAR